MLVYRFPCGGRGNCYKLPGIKCAGKFGELFTDNNRPLHCLRKNLFVFKFSFSEPDLLFLAGKNRVGIIRIDPDNQKTHRICTDINECDNPVFLTGIFNFHRITGFRLNTRVKRSDFTPARCFSTDASPYAVTLTTISCPSDVQETACTVPRWR